MLLDALHELGIHGAEKSGRNDIVIGGKKVGFECERIGIWVGVQV